MLGAKLVLGAMLLAIAALNFLIWGVWTPSSPEPLTLKLVAAAPTWLFTLAIGLTFWLSTAKAKIQGGKLVIDSNCFYVKFSEWATYGGGIKRWEAQNICQLFWEIIFQILLVLGIIFTLSCVLIGLPVLIYKQTKSGLNPDSKEALQVVAASMILTLTALVSFVCGADAKKGLNKFLFFTAGGVVLFGLFFFLGPLYLIADKKNIAMSAALPAYWEIFLHSVPWILLAVLIVLAGIGAFFGLLFLIFEMFEGLRRSFIGRILAAGWHVLKTRTCPTIVWLGLDNADQTEPDQPKAGPTAPE